MPLIIRRARRGGQAARVARWERQRRPDGMSVSAARQAIPEDGIVASAIATERNGSGGKCGRNLVITASTCFHGQPGAGSTTAVRLMRQGRAALAKRTPPGNLIAPDPAMAVTNSAMTLTTKLWLIFAAPLAVLAVATGLAIASTPRLAGLAYVQRVDLGRPAQALDLPQVAGPRDRTRPLLVIDPGHGGHDPGASGGGAVEKALVLGLAKALRDRLAADGGIRVALTREGDRYLALDERFEIARRLGADLFLSIHADSAGEQGGVSGSSIYTLSERASSEAAARYAARENRADRINGADLSAQSAPVEAILVDLSQRRAIADAEAFAALVVREGDGRLPFHPQPRRSASLAVLRAPDIPSVLYEAGFITNTGDAARLTSPEGRATFADAMSRAVRVYFARAGSDAGSGQGD